MARRRRGIDTERIERMIVPVSDADEHVTGLVYARNKKGKTSFAATGPKPLIIDINEHGTRSVRRTDAHVIRVGRHEDLWNTYWYLKAGNHDFETWTIDTLTSMNELMMRHVMKENAELDPNKEPSTPSKRDYGRAGTHMKRLILAYRNLPMHGVFLAQERVISNEETGEPELVTADLPAGVRATALGAVEFIGRMYMREVEVKKRRAGKVRRVSQWEARMLVGPHELYDTGSRDLPLPRIIRNPTMQQIINAYATKED